MRKAKASLIATIAIGLLAISTAGVSTYAWFQAASQVQIQASGDSTTITVAKPDDITVSNPSVYMYRGDPAGTNVSSYTPVSTVISRTLTDFCPGEIITFAVKVTATSGTIGSGSMDLTYRGFSLSNRTIYGTSGASLKVVNALSAIKLSTGANGTGTYPSMTQKLTPLARGSEFLLSDLTRVDETNRYYKQDKIDSAISSATISSTNAYFFYTVEFLNNPSTFYIEKNSDGSVNHSTPSNDSSTRFFTGGNAGSSTAYEKLDFNVTKLEITVS